MITVSIKDAITPLVQRYLENNPRMIRSLSKSIGWFVRGNVRKYLRDDRFTSRWKRRVPYEIRQKLEQGKAPKAWYGKLRQAIVYSYNDSNNTVSVGWGSHTAAMEGRIQEFGNTRTVTPLVRRYFALRGVPLSNRKQFIKVPARPLFEPTMDKMHSELGEFVTDRVQKWMQNNGKKVTLYHSLDGDNFENTSKLFQKYPSRDHDPHRNYEVFG